MSNLLHQHPISRPPDTPEDVFPAGRRLELALEISRLGTWILDPATSKVHLDSRMMELWGEPPNPDAQDVECLLKSIHPEDAPAVKSAIAAALDPRGAGSYSVTYRVIHRSGRTCWITTIGQAEFTGSGENRRVVSMIGTARDATEEKRTEALLLAQKQLLERIARGETLPEILLAIVEVIEEQCWDALAAIMLVDRENDCLRHAAATSLPTDYLMAVDGIRIHRDTGTCAAAAALNEPVFTPDFATDPRWDGLSHLPLGLGLKGAWSFPIRGSDGSVLGTLGTYSREGGRPDERLVRIVGMLAETAALAIEGAASREKFQALSRETLRRQRLYEAVVTNTPDLICVFDLQHRFTYANPALLEMWGTTWEASVGKTCHELGHPDWLAELHDREIDYIVRTGQPVKGEVPFAGARGLRHYEYKFFPIFGADGEVEAISGSTRDVTDRKNAEQRASFLANLTKRLAALPTEREVVTAAVEEAGAFLGAHRCYFIECRFEENEIEVGPNWLREPETEAIEGKLNLFDFGGAEWWEAFSSGNLAIRDVREDPLTAENAASYVELQVLSYAVQPFETDGRHTVVLAATEAAPREWTGDELFLLESVVARVWPLVQHIRSEKALRESEEHLRLIADHAPALISYVDRDCRYQFANESYMSWFGRSRKEVIGLHIRDVLGEEAFEVRWPFIQRALAGESVRLEGGVVHHELGQRELELALVPYIDGKGDTRGFFVMGFDITEHKRARRSLTQRGDRLRLLWESAGILLTTEDPETMLQRLFEGIGSQLGADTYFNFTVEPGGTTMRLRSWHGLSEEEAQETARLGVGQGMCGKVALAFRPIIVPGFVDGVHHDSAGHFGIKAYAGYPLVKDGEIFGTLAFASRTRDAFSEDELEFLETISHYITAAYVRLELVASLREADRRKDEFLATLAHELRNPLAPIRTGIEVLKQVSDQPAKAAAIMGIIERQTAQMVRLIDDLIDVSRITRGILELRRSDVDLLDVLAGAVEASQPLVDSRKHTLTVNLPAGPVPIHGDASRLSQVFSNLLNNAARYTPAGGRIRLALERAGDTVSVVVADNGDGIEPEMQAHIFEMFTQVKRPGNCPTDGGLGIGLTLVRLLTGMHGGTITVHSEGSGKGSEFRVTLPCLAALQPPAEPAAEPADPAGCKLLIVDDGASAADMLAMFFTLHGYQTRTAYNGPRALEIAADFRPRVAFIDIGMPGMDGNETARRLRRIPGCETTILIALTGWGQEDDRKKTAEAGFDHHLVKPAEPAMLRDLLARLDLAEA